VNISHVFFVIKSFKLYTCKCFLQVIWLWSAQTCKYMDEFHVPTGSALVDYDFDENKV
jgi:hypothetical protein